MLHDVVIAKIISLTLLICYVSAFSTVIIHELGHMICGRLVGIRARIVSIGQGPRLARLRLGETWLDLRAIPVSGSVRPYPSCYITRRAEIFFILGGPLANALLPLFIMALCRLVGDWYLPLFLPLPIMILIGNLIPLTGQYQGRTVHSDGRNLLRMIRPSYKKDLSANLKLYRGWIASYSKDIDRENTKDASVDRILYHFPFLLKTDPELNGEAIAALEREVKRGRLSSVASLMILDTIMTLGLIYDKEYSAARRRGWVEQAQSLGTDRVKIKFTCGAVMIDLGMMEQGMSLLQTAKAEPTVHEFDLFLSTLFLAKGHFALKHEKEAQVILDEAHALATNLPATLRLAPTILRRVSGEIMR